MHIIDRKWTDLAAGYQTAQLLQTKLEAEFGRAVQVGSKQKFRKELTEWQKKRRVFFALVAIAPLSIIALCLAAFYLRNVACVIVYWVIVVLTILVTLAVAGRNYIREAMNRPEPGQVKALAVDLEQRWWANLSPQELVSSKGNARDKADSLTLLSQTLPETYLAKRGLLAADDSDVLLLGESGLWLLVVKDWSGAIIRQDNAWKQVHAHQQEVMEGQAPDEHWLQEKREIGETLEKYLPQQAWTVSLLQGGVAFIHPKAKLEKSRIQGSTAAYGPVKAWAKRIHRAQSVDGFTLAMQLEILDVLIASLDDAKRPGVPSLSAKEEAGRLYQEAAEELRQSIAEMVK